MELDYYDNLFGVIVIELSCQATFSYKFILYKFCVPFPFGFCFSQTQHFRFMLVS